MVHCTAGVAVLAWAQTAIFEVYYFRMYMALVVLAALHALVLLPVRIVISLKHRLKQIGWSVSCLQLRQCLSSSCCQPAKPSGCWYVKPLPATS